jgi:hypothetical protein
VIDGVAAKLDAIMSDVFAYLRSNDTTGVTSLACDGTTAWLRDVFNTFAYTTLKKNPSALSVLNVLNGICLEAPSDSSMHVLLERILLTPF